MPDDLFDPFENSTVCDIRRIDDPIKDLNEAPLNHLIRQFDWLTEGPLPRHNRLPKVQFVLSAQAGYGKSFLLGLLFKKLRGRATLVYLRPFTDPATCWKSILEQTVQELDHPEKVALGTGPNNEPTQLQIFAHGVLTRLAVLVLEKEIRDNSKKVQTIRYLHEVTLHNFRSKENNIKVLHRNLPYMAEMLDFRRIPLTASASSWLNLLHRFAYNSVSYELRETARDWLKGGSIDQGEAKEIGIRLADLPDSEFTNLTANQLCKTRLLDICRLAGFYRPFIFCFDQTESYNQDKTLAANLGQVMATLFNEGTNNMVIMTANQTPWKNTLKPHWEQAHLDRLSHPLELEGLQRKQAEELVTARLATGDYPSNLTVSFKKPTFFDVLFEGKSEIGIRQFLNESSIQWRELTRKGKPQVSLEELFQKKQEEIKAQPNRLGFSQDYFIWLVGEVGGKLPGVNVEKFTGDKDHYTFRWQTGDQVIIFGKESGSHHKRWEALAKEAQSHFLADRRCKIVMFRTKELPPVPGENWQTKEIIEEAQRNCLQILWMDYEEITNLYAARDLYLDAKEGNINFDPEEVLIFVSSRLKPLLDGIQAPMGGQN